MHTCRTCEAPLSKGPGRGRWPWFCADECRTKYRREHPRRLHHCQCERCDQPFMGRRAGQRFCGRSCSSRARGQMWQVRHGVTKRACPHCGTVFVEKGPRQQYCSRTCAREAFNLIRNALRRGQGWEGEPATIAYLFKRDGGICQRCQKPVDPSLKHPHPMSASMDHQLPVSRGGLWSKANVQLMHLTCNIRKRAKAGGQLRLIG